MPDRTIKTKFYTYSQNNSGGYFITNNDYGVSEIVIIEALNAKDAWGRLEDIGDSVSGFWTSCSCCGDRWSSWIEDEDGTEVPMLYDKKIEEVKKGMFNKVAFVHYYDKNFRRFVLK
jgi:hypothetical protein